MNTFAVVGEFCTKGSLQYISDGIVCDVSPSTSPDSPTKEVLRIRIHRRYQRVHHHPVPKGERRLCHVRQDELRDLVREGHAPVAEEGEEAV